MSRGRPSIYSGSWRGRFRSDALAGAFTLLLAADSEKGGAQLWAENCSRCHNSRPPQSFSDTQWQAITMHMRLRADLTGPETRKITEFLKASD